MNSHLLMKSLVVWALSVLTLHAAPLPLHLPRPDGQPGNSKKPVKVYILAGQSNMVGMGGLDKAPPPNNVFLVADPAIIPGRYAFDRPGELKTLFGVGVDWLGFHDVKLAGKTLTAQMDVPKTGTYHVHAGTGDSSANVATVAGKEAYRKEVGGKPALTKVTLETGKRYPVQIDFFQETSKVFWLEEVDLQGKGDLVTLTKKDGKFQYLIDDKGEWTARNDVTYMDPRLFSTRAPSPLSAMSNNGKSIGPELGFGSVMGTFHDEQVLIIKSANGNRSLQWDFRPPSSGRTAPANDFEGYEYRAMVKHVRDTLANIDKVVPGYAGQGYEIAGFGWFQGHKDQGLAKEEYEKHLVNLIQDLRKEFKAPKMPAVVATLGFMGYRFPSSWKGVWEAQMAVGDPAQHPELAGTVASVDTRDFWRGSEESPKNQYYHYNWNAETYMLVGETMGRAMVRLEGGEAEPIPKSDREQRVAAENAKPTPTPEQWAAHRIALRPVVIDGALASFLKPVTTQSKLKAAMASQKTETMLDDIVDFVATYYRAVGVGDYDWKPFGSNTKLATWDYFGFDLPGTKRTIKVEAEVGEDDGDDPEPAAKTREKKEDSKPPSIVLPEGIENWYAPDFDARKAGWKCGVGPFGAVATTNIPETVIAWRQKRKIERPLPATVTDKDVLLLRQTFDFPAFKDGYRYRLRIEGSPHNNMGEGYAIYINGKLLSETRNGLTAWHRQVFNIRGTLIVPEFRNEFTGRKVTIAVANYPLWGRAAERFIPPGPGLSVCLEEQKLPPVGE